MESFKKVLKTAQIRNSLDAVCTSVELSSDSLKLLVKQNGAILKILCNFMTLQICGNFA